MGLLYPKCNTPGEKISHLAFIILSSLKKDTITIVSPIELVRIIKVLKKQFHDARHHCYAYRIGLNDEKFRMNDDGEPSGTAGKPIYGQILSHDLSDILIVVVRYFGGTLLGTSGLINAYKCASKNGIENGEIVVKQITREINLKFSYEQLSYLMRIVKEYNLELKKQDFTDQCFLKLMVRESKYEQILNLFKEMYGVEIIQ